MEAIQSIEYATLEIPRRSSPFRALVWKEWRQQKWIFFSLAGLAYGLLAAALLMACSGSFSQADYDVASAIFGCAAFIGIVGIVVLSANAFSGEREDNTDQFLATIPCSRGRLFRVKLGFVLFLIMLELVPLGAAPLVVEYLAGSSHAGLIKLAGTFGAIAAAVLALATVPALVSLFSGSVVATVLASMPVAVIVTCLAYMHSSELLALFVSFERREPKDVLPALYTLLMVATVLQAAWRIWIRPERTWRSTLSTAAATAGLLIAYVAVPVVASYAYHLYSIFFALPKFLVTVIAILFAATLLGARQIWIRVERLRRSSVCAVAAIAGLLIAFFALPVAAMYLYVAFFAPLSFFRAGDDLAPLASWKGFSISPDCKHMTFTAGYRGWGPNGERTALIDLDSGRTRWLTRFQSSAVPNQNMTGIWSPSGNQFVLTEADTWLWPLARESTKGMSTNVKGTQVKGTQVKYFVVDARSGEKHSFDELCPGLPPMYSNTWEPAGWYSDQVFAFYDGWDILFADIEHHEARYCKMPAAIPRSQYGNLYGLAFTQRGIFAAPFDPLATAGALRVLRYAPELPQAESLVLNVSGLSGLKDRLPLSASTDGHWLLANFQAPFRNERLWYLAQPIDGAKATLLTSPIDGEKGLIPISWQMNGFVPRSHLILLSNDTGLGIFDADSHDLRRIPQKAPVGWWGVQVSPGGGFAFYNVANSDRSFIVDLRLGTSLELNLLQSYRVSWLDEDHLLAVVGYDPEWKWIFNRDGTGARPLLAK